jgi:hypothetical protein
MPKAGMSGDHLRGTEDEERRQEGSVKETREEKRIAESHQR